MFVKNCWKPASETEIFEVIEQNPWGLLVSNGAESEDGIRCGPMATNLRFVLVRERRMLVSHIARANDHAALLLADSSPSLTVFEGPSSYVTSSWYPGRDMPPTVYYTAVHCYGRLVLQNDMQLRAALEDLTERSESAVCRRMENQ